MYIRGGGKGGGGGAGGTAMASTVSRERAAQLAAAGAPGWTTRNDYNRALVPNSGPAPGRGTAERDTKAAALRGERAKPKTAPLAKPDTFYTTFSHKDAAYHQGKAEVAAYKAQQTERAKGTAKAFAGARKAADAKMHQRDVNEAMGRGRNGKGTPKAEATGRQYLKTARAKREDVAKAPGKVAPGRGTAERKQAAQLLTNLRQSGKGGRSMARIVREQGIMGRRGGKRVKVGFDATEVAGRIRQSAQTLYNDRAAGYGGYHLDGRKLLTSTGKVSIPALRENHTARIISHNNRLTPAETARELSQGYRKSAADFARSARTLHNAMKGAGVKPDATSALGSNVHDIRRRRSGDLKALRQAVGGRPKPAPDARPIKLRNRPTAAPATAKPARVRPSATVTVEHPSIPGRGTRQWVARIKGVGGQYGLEREFVRGARATTPGAKGVMESFKLNRGQVYEMATAKPGRPDIVPRSFARVDRKGKVKEMTRDRAERMIRLRQRYNML